MRLRQEDRMEPGGGRQLAEKRERMVKFVDRMGIEEVKEALC